MAGEIKIKIEADLGNTIPKLKSVNEELGKTAVQSTSAAKSFEGFGGKILPIGNAASSAATGLTNMGNAATGAAGGVTEVAGGLTEMGTALLEGGIAVGISLIAIALVEMAKELFAASAAEVAFNESLAASTKIFADAKAEVSELSQEIQLAIAGFLDKDEVVKHYNETIGKTTGLVNDVKEAEAQLIAKGEAYIKMMRLKTIANFAYQKSAEAFVELVKLQDALSKGGALSFGSYALKKQIKELEDLMSSYDATAKAATNLRTKISIESGSNFFGNNEAVKNGKSVQDILDKLILKISALSEVKEKIRAIKAAIVDLVTNQGVNPKGSIINSLNQDIKNLESQLPAAAEKIKAHIRDVNDVVSDLQKQLAYLSVKENGIYLETDQAKAKIAAIEQAIKELVTKFGKGAKDKIIIDLVAEINFIKHKQTLDQFIDPGKIYAEELRTPRTVKIHVKPKLIFDEDAFKEFKEKLDAAVEQAIEGMLIGVGESIGNALAAGGEQVVPNLFGGLMKSVGQQIVELGKFLITSSTIMKTAKEAFKNLFKNPILGIIAGIALIAIGTLLKSQASKQFPGFASGTRSFGGGAALVGERGPERVFLPAGSSVQPNNELRAFGGSGSGIIAETRIAGQDLIIMLQRAQQTLDRNN